MRAKIVAIVNVTPDSFSDGNSTPHDALAHIKRAIEGGADVVDIGAESTRPGATPLTADEEWQRLAPVLAALPRDARVHYSVDTRHASTAKRALEYGIDWINDVSGFSSPAMLEAVKDSDCKLVLMHSLSVPADKTIVMPQSVDVVQEICDFARARMDEMEACGIDRNRIIFDPGIGFGKTAEQSQQIIDGISRLLALSVPLLVGHSRKSFLGGSMSERDAATLQVSQMLAGQGVAYLRVHDVTSHAKIVKP